LGEGCLASRRQGLGEPLEAGEELSAVVEQTHQGGGHAQHMAGYPRQPIERLIGWGVQQAGATHGGYGVRVGI
jgi:hypothetical protein